MAFTTSTGRLSTMPPSTKTRPSSSTAVKTPGTAMLARMAVARFPWSSTCAVPLCRSVATARYGIGKRSKFVMAAERSVASCSRLLNFCPAAMPVPILGPRKFNPISKRYRWSSCFRRK